MSHYFCLVPADSAQRAIKCRVQGSLSEHVKMSNATLPAPATRAAATTCSANIIVDSAAVAICLLASSVVALPANILVAGRILQLRLALSQSFAVYILSIAASDILYVLCDFGQIFIQLQYVGAYDFKGPTDYYFNGPLGSMLCPGFACTKFFCWNISSWLIVAMSAERLIAVVYPLKVASLCRPRRALFTVAVVVCLSFPVCVTGGYFQVPVVIRSYYLYQPAFSYRLVCFNYAASVMVTALDYIAEAITTFVPAVVLVGLSVMLIQCSRRALRGPGGAGSGASKALQLRVVSTVLGICSSFVLLLVPYSVVRVVLFLYAFQPFYVGSIGACTVNFLRGLQYIADAVRLLSALCNPLVYIMRSGKFRFGEVSK